MIRALKENHQVKIKTMALPRETLQDSIVWNEQIQSLFISTIKEQISSLTGFMCFFMSAHTVLVSSCAALKSVYVFVWYKCLNHKMFMFTLLKQ